MAAAPGDSAPSVDTYTCLPCTAMPVGTESQPTVPGLACAPGSRQAGVRGFGGTKNVDTFPVRGFTRNTSFAPPSATSSPHFVETRLNGLDSAS